MDRRGIQNTYSKDGTGEIEDVSGYLNKGENSTGHKIRAVKKREVVEEKGRDVYNYIGQAGHKIRGIGTGG